MFSYPDTTFQQATEVQRQYLAAAEQRRQAVVDRRRARLAARRTQSSDTRITRVVAMITGRARRGSADQRWALTPKAGAC